MDELGLQPGDLVEVRGAEEILGTLDADGALEGLPFMPEMLPFCGHRFRVFRRAHKTCDTVNWSGLRGMDRTVHLEMLRCDGGGHGGCQAGCLLFWKEAWLRRVSETSNNGAGANGAAANGVAQNGIARNGHHRATPEADSSTEKWLRERAQTAPLPGESEQRFRCQATQLPQATYRLSALQPTQYVCDVRSHGASWTGVLKGVMLSAFNRARRLMKKPTFPMVVGELKRTPHVELGLKAGDLVDVKSHDEILATLDRTGKNRGLTFDSEMVPYCGQRFRVLRRVETIVDEATGKLRTLPGACIVLEGVVCRGLYHRFCPRSIYPYWREIWLRPVATPSMAESDAQSNALSGAAG